MKHVLKNTDFLNKELKKLGLQSIEDKLMQYLLLLQKWNAAYNLTAIRDIESMVTKHLLDSLAILPFIHGTRILDVGTGAGLPGIPLALAKPNLHYVLLDSNGKKIRFLHEAKRQLDLKNTEIVEFRVENYRPTQGFDTVLSRAFSDIEDMLHKTSHLIAEQGIWLAMKGRYPEAELAKLCKPYEVEHYAVEGLEGERCCVIIKN